MIESDIEVYIKPGPTPAYPNNDGKTVLEGIIRAWKDAGGNPRYHDKMQRRVRTEMPILARWLDKVAEQGHIEVLFRERLRTFYEHYEEQLVKFAIAQSNINKLCNDLATEQNRTGLFNRELAASNEKVNRATSELISADEAIADARGKRIELEQLLADARRERDEASDLNHSYRTEAETLTQRLEQDGAQLQAIQEEHREMGELLRTMTTRYEEAQHNYASETARANILLEKANEWQTESQRKRRQLTSAKQRYDRIISDPRRMVQMGLEMLQRTHAANQASMVNDHFEAIKTHAEEMLALTDVSGMDRVLPEEGDTPGDEPNWREPEDTRDPLHTNPLHTAQVIARQRAAEIVRENASNPEEQYRRGEANDFNG
jgi:hypothetical protein